MGVVIMVNWDGRRVLVTGGASFIGSHLVKRLVTAGAYVTVIDDFSSGRRANLEGVVDGIEIRHGDLAHDNLLGGPCDVIFHLAADHGGRGYIDTHQSAGGVNMLMDQRVFAYALERSSKVVYASSGCIYPTHLQTHEAGEFLLREHDDGPPYAADNLYGWAKLMGEMTLQAYYAEHGLPSVSLRYFTVYGPRAKEDHAVMALIAKAYTGQDPFEIWGDGKQVRNWTFVDDIVEGTVLAAERVDDASAINLGTEERTTVKAAAELICASFNHNPRFFFDVGKPTGPVNRVASNQQARELLEWRPKTLFRDGVAETIAWYTQTKGRGAVKKLLEGGALMNR